MTAKKKIPDIVHAMIGTAGHVSHGKSTLVEILTGCQMNRLPEERDRGLTINLGFAACFLPGDRLVGIVDVPGHKDFIRNMVAGAASIDILMLVIAADDGVMPQTEEHVKIARILGAERVMVVITKTDLVDAELLDLVRDDVTGFMARRGFPDAPVICFSSKSLEGLDEVLESLLQRDLLAYTLTLKVKYADFSQVTRSYTGDTIISVRKKAVEIIPVLLAKTDVNTKSIRLLGISFSNLQNHEDFSNSQLPLF